MIGILHVFSPMGDPRQVEYAEGRFTGQKDETRHELVGMIADYPVDDSGLAMAQRDFPNAKATFVVRRVHHAENKIGAAVYLALFVDSMEQAEGLRGFMPIFEYSGGFELGS